MSFILSFFKVFASSAVLVPLLKRVLVALGISAVSLIGVSAVMGVITDAVITNYSGLPADVIAVMKIAKLPNAINIIISAYTASLTIRGLTSAGSMQRILWKPGMQGTLF
jgi:hypothetical protein